MRKRVRFAGSNLVSFPARVKLVGKTKVRRFWELLALPSPMRGLYHLVPRILKGIVLPSREKKMKIGVKNRRVVH